MLEDALPSIWALVHGWWFTPAVFFVLLNVVIGTIAVTSTRTHQTTSSADGGPTTLTGKISRLPFPVLDRIKSFSLTSYRSSPPKPQIQPETLKIQPPPPTTTAAAVEFRPPPLVEEIHINRTRSETRPAAGEILKKLPKKMKKSASARSAFAHFEFGEVEEEKTAEEVEDRRPATARADLTPSVVEEEEEESGEVDARADVFINKFRNQLKLQRMDSFVRYKEMIKRGGN